MSHTAARARLVLIISSLGVVGMISAALASDVLDFADGPSPSPVTTLPTRDDLVGAAAASLTEEEARVLKANASFEQELLTNPDQAGLYIVSLANAVDVGEIVESSGTLKISAVYMWLQASGSDFPIVGELDMSESPTATDLRTEVIDYLERRIAALREGIAGEEASDEQIADVEALLAGVKSGPLLVHGFRCECSPKEIDSFDGVALLAVEAAETSETSYPIPMSNPIRDALLGASE